ncbi:MAG: hypothetical protein ACOYJ2_06685 [Rickettsiales bacterium]
MGWKGAVRTIQADMRRAARETERARKQDLKIQQLQEAQNAVEAFEKYLNKIAGFHKARSLNPIQWQDIAERLAPQEPKKSNRNEEKAKHVYETFRPNLLHKLFKSEEKKRDVLKKKIDVAVLQDQEIYQNELSDYQLEYEKWNRQKQLAKRVIAQEPQSYIDAIKEFNVFSDIENLGVGVKFFVDTLGNITADLNVQSEDIIPKEKYSLRSSGTLSVKDMPKSEFYTLYQDYVCSAVMRVASELFMLVPIQRCIVNAKDNLLNGKTGHIEEQTILSVLIPQETLKTLNLSNLDPSDSMKNFLHSMKFKKTAGFELVEPLLFDDMKLS